MMLDAVKIFICLGLLVALANADSQAGSVTIHLKGPVKIVIGNAQEGHGAALQCSGGNGLSVKKETECSSPWVSLWSSGCLLFVQEDMFWNPAREHCLRKDADLATVEVESKRIALENYMISEGMRSSHWIGGTKRSGVWLWVKDDTLVTGGWSDGGKYWGTQPEYVGNDMAANRLCMTVRTETGQRGLFWDTYCNGRVKNSFICEK